MRAALYARVSTEEQTEGYSIDAQRRAFQALCEGRGWTPYHEYIEAGRSAHTDDIRRRPVFKQAIEDALAGKYDVLVVHKIDRFARKLRITLEYFDKLGKAGVGFVSIQNQMDYSTPHGKLMLSMQGALAEFYSDNLSDEIKKGWTERRAQGLYCGPVPFGAKKGRSKKVPPGPHPDTYPGLVMAYELAAQGKTDRAIAIALNESGYRTGGNRYNGPFGKDTVREMLRNRFYLGELPDGNGGWIKARHKPFISEELFNAAATQRAERHRGKSLTIRRKPTLVSLSGIARCGICDSNIATQQIPSGRIRIYCRGRTTGKNCDCRGTFIDVYEAQIQWYLDNFIIPEDYRERILDAHRKLESAYDDTEKHRTMLENRLKRLQEQYEWGHIQKDEYLDKHNPISRELAVLTPSDTKNETLDRLARFLKDIGAAWVEATQEQRNRLASALFEDIIIRHNRVVAVRPREELRPFFKLSYEEFLKVSRANRTDFRHAHP